MSVESFLSKPVRVIQDDSKALVRVYGQLSEPRFRGKFPENISIFLASGGIHKLEDWRRIQRGYKPRLFLINALTALKDSHELETNPADIAVGKLNETLGDFREMGHREREEVFRIAGIESDEQVLEMSEDRYIILDKRLQDHEGFDEFRDLPLIKECFAQGAEWPSYRYKELTDAMGGVTEFLKILERAYEELPQKDPEKYADLSRKHSSGISVALRPHKPGLIPLPSEGIVIEAIEHGLTIKFPTTEYLSELEKKDKLNDIDLSYFEYPAGQKDPTSKLRIDGKNPYFDETSIVARVWEALCDIYDIPELAVPRSFEPIKVRPATILSNKKVGKRKQPKGISIVESDKFQSLADIEQSAVSSYGIVLQVPRGITPDTIKKPHTATTNFQRSARLYEVDALLKKVGLLVRFTEAVTQKTLHNRFYAGEPILVEKAPRPWINPMMRALNNRKAMSLKPSMVFSWIKDISASELDDKLLWDPSDYTSPETLLKPAPFALMDERKFRALTNIGSNRLRLAFIGSASVSIPCALNDTRYCGSEAAKAGFVIIDGGGTRPNTVMGAMREGSIAAYRMGYKNFKHIGHVVPLTARREANFGQFQEENGLSYTRGNEDDDHFVYDNLYHFIRHETLAARQHGIEGASDAMLEFAGGIGTNFESFSMGYNNLLVLRAQIENESPRGFFPGFHNRIRPIFVVNSLINGSEKNGRYSDYKREIFNERELDLMAKSLHNSGEDAMEQVRRFERDQKPLPVLRLVS